MIKSINLDLDLPNGRSLNVGINDLKDLVVIAGENGVGKSFLNAFAWFAVNLANFLHALNKEGKTLELSDQIAKILKIGSFGDANIYGTALVGFETADASYKLNIRFDENGEVVADLQDINGTPSAIEGALYLSARTRLFVEYYSYLKLIETICGPEVAELSIPDLIQLPQEDDKLRLYEKIAGAYRLYDLQVFEIYRSFALKSAKENKTLADYIDNETSQLLNLGSTFSSSMPPLNTLRGYGNGKLKIEDKDVLALSNGEQAFINIFMLNLLSGLN